jgi:restriction system protein
VVDGMIPKFWEIFKPMLEFLSDQKIHSMSEVEEYLAKYFKLTEEERKKLLPSGKQELFKNRIGWAKTYLYKAKLIDTPERGKVVITDRGLEELKNSPQKIDVKYLMKFPELVEFLKAHKSEKVSQGEISPEEEISQKIEEINKIVKDELLNKILNAPPDFFERLVLDLIVKMGYGGSFEEAKELLGKSGDEGVDGVIKEDILGLDNVYLQAKRWSKDSIVGRPEIQKFVGALHGKGAKKGIFITTATFSRDAIEYARDLKDIKVILIDKDKLLDLMLKYDVGVQTKRLLEIKKVDEDYFEEY